MRHLGIGVNMLDSKKWEEKATEIMDKYGMFFCFGDKQFHEKKVKGVEYTSLLGWGVCPVENRDAFIKEFRAFNLAYAKGELEKYGEEKIIMHELRNHEFQLCPDVERVAEALAVYGLNESHVRKYVPAYMKLCNENDWY